MRSPLLALARLARTALLALLLAGRGPLLALAVAAAWLLLAADVALAHDCSGPADCEQTAGYNATVALVGGLIGIIASIFGTDIAHTLGGLLGGQLGGLPPDLLRPSDGAATATGQPTLEPGPGRPIVDPWTGEPLVQWQPGTYGPGENGQEGKPGQVWFGGNWVDPQDARDRIREGLEADARRQQESDAFWQESQRLSEDWMRRRVAELQHEAQQERLDRQRREDAWTALENIQNIADRHGFQDIWERANENAFNPDGSLNVDYVNQLRGVMRGRLGRDLAAPDEELQKGWVSDFASSTWDDVRHSTAVRILTGLATGGSSEVFFQSQAALEAMQRSFDKASDNGKDWDFTDAIRAGFGQLAEENLPLNTIRALQDPNAGFGSVLMAGAMDLFVAGDVAQTMRNLRGSLGGLRNGDGFWDALTHRADALHVAPGGDDVARWPGPQLADDLSILRRNVNDLPPGSQVRPTEFGMPPQNGRGFQVVADKYGLNIEARGTNPEAVNLLANGHPPKPPDLKSKTINELDTYLGAPPDARGQVGYFPPRLPDARPPGMSDATWEALQKRHMQRVDEFADQELKMHKLQEQGLVRVENGVVIDTGLSTGTPGAGTGKGFTGDHDVFRITPRGGGDLPDAVKQQVVKDLEDFGVQHGAHMDWHPASSVDQGIDSAVIGKHVHSVEGGSREALISFGSDRPPMTTFARPDDLRGATTGTPSVDWLGGSRE